MAVFNGVAKHIVNLNRYKVGSKMHLVNKYRLFLFAEEAIDRLRKACPSAICDGLVRVDIFQAINGTLRVNELESLEASYNCNNHCMESAMETCLESYWSTLLSKSVKPYF